MPVLRKWSDWQWHRQQQHIHYESLIPKSEKIEDDESEIPLSLPSSVQIPRKLRRLNLTLGFLPWALCIILSASLATVSSDHRKAHRHGSYETGFDTDLGPAKPSLGLTKVKFYGGIQVDPNGTYYLTHNPDEPHYVGESSPEIDDAWERMLLHKRYLGLTPKEAAETDFPIDEKDWIFDLYWVSPNTFHTLHCLNYIRRSLDRAYYTDIEDLPARPFRMTHRMHLDHCIESIRQTVQCSLDITPVPRPWIPQAGIYHADIDQWHTCRDFSAVRNWMDWRNRDENDDDFINVTHRYKDRNAPYAKWNPW